MTAFNYIHTTIIGELDQTLSTPLYDTDPATNLPRIIDLTGYTVRLTVTTPGGVKIIDDQPCVVDNVPSTGKITFTYDATVQAFPNLVPGDNLMRFTLIAPSGKKTFAPKKDKDTFGIFRVLPDL